MIDGNQLLRLEFVTDQVEDIAPVRAFPNLQELSMTGKVGKKGKLTDLEPLRGMALVHLNISNNKVENLDAVRKMPLTTLYINNTLVRDLSPLRDCKDLSIFVCWGTRVNNLSPLRDLPLRGLDIHEVFDPQRDLEMLKGIKTLEHINGLTREEFFKNQLKK